MRSLLDIFVEGTFYIITIICFFRFKEVAALHLAAFIAAGILYMVYMLLDGRRKADFKIFVLMVAAMVMAAVSWVVSGNMSDNGIVYYVLFYCKVILTFMVTVDYMNAIGVKKFIRFIKRLMPIFIVYLIAEFIYRYRNAGSVYKGNKWFLNYKGESFSYSDSNFLGLELLFLSCLLVYLYKITKNKIFRTYVIIIMLFEILTFSRSIIITQTFILYLELCRLGYKKGMRLIPVIDIAAIPIAFVAIYHYFLSDDSFRSKIEIFNSIGNIADYDIENRLFGFGFGKGEYALSYKVGSYGHTHFAMLLGQVGIIGMLLFIFLILWFEHVSNHATFMLLIAFLVSGFSLTFFDSSFFYCVGVICAISWRRNRNMIWNHSLRPQIVIRH